jgi:hypothetical protein
MPTQDLSAELNDFIGVDNESIITPAEVSIFKRPENSFEDFAAKVQNNIPIEELKVEDKKENAEPKPPTVEPKKTVELSQETNNVLDKLTSFTPEELAQEKENVSKAKLDKSSTIEYLKEKIEAKEFVPFEDYDEKVPLEEYLSKLSKKDLHSLLDENIKIKEETVKSKAPQELFESLPYELQVAADYWINKGGRNLKGLFQALGRVEEVRELNPENEDDHEPIVQQYLRNANSDWTEEEVSSQVEEWKDLGLLGKKAAQLKPKLDKMNEQLVAYEIQQQEIANQKRQEAANTYISNVYNALKPGEINGIKVDNRTRDLLYDGLTNPRYKSISGSNTNLLGHLLEKYQYQEPNYALISEVLWHLQDPDGFKNTLKTQGANAKTEETMKKLKTQSQSNSSSTGYSEAGDNGSRVQKQSYIPKAKSIFER